jgi:carbamoyl-phosphate synthase large subunit
MRGTIFVSVKNRDKRNVIFLAKRLQDLGFQMVATEGTSRVLRRNGIDAEMIYRVSDPRGRNAIDMIHDGDIDLIFNTPRGREEHADQIRIRHEAVRYNVPVITTIAGAHAAVRGIEALQSGDIQVEALQAYHERLSHLAMGSPADTARHATP